MVVPSVRDAHLLRMNNSLPRGYLSGPRPLSDAIPGAPASAVVPAIIIVSENQRPPLHMGWRGHLLRSLASPSLQSPWDQPRGPGSPLADRAPPRRLRRRPVRLPRLRIRQELPEGPYLERPRDAEAPQGERAARRHPAPAAQHPGRRVLGRPGRGVELPPDAALRRRRDDDDGAIHPPHDAGEPAARDDGEDLPGVRHRHPGRPDRQGQLLVPGGEGPPPHGPQLDARPGLRFDELHEATRDDAAPGADPALRLDQQHRPRLQRPVEQLAARSRLLLPDGDHGRAGGPRPGPLDVREGAELLDRPDGEDYGGVLRASRSRTTTGTCAASPTSRRKRSAWRRRTSTMRRSSTRS